MFNSIPDRKIVTVGSNPYSQNLYSLSATNNYADMNDVDDDESETDEDSDDDVPLKKKQEKAKWTSEEVYH
jgi:hypothetical protein